MSSSPALSQSSKSSLKTMPPKDNHSTPQDQNIGNFSINAVAKHLSVHRSTVERLLHGGEFGKDWWRIGRKIIIPKENVFAYERRKKRREEDIAA
jgi:excisionase family DNA binding protein